MARITFESVASRFTILNPFNNFAPEPHEVEVRKDPLLGDTSVYNPFLKDKARFFFGENDRALITRLADDSASTCIFCPGNVTERTARYPDGLVPGGRIAEGEAVLFANTFSVANYHAVVALGKAHFLELSQFTPKLIADAFTAARKFLLAVYRQDSSAVFTTVNANYLQPAGASLVHPHIQMLISPLPYSLQARMLAALGRHHGAHKTSYFDDLVAEERKTGSRYIGKTGRWHWLAAFSPLGSNEIMAVHEIENDLGGLTNEDLHDVADGIAKVLALYGDMGHLSFNFSLFGVANSIPAEGFRCVLKIVSRQNLSSSYRNDDYFLQKLLQTELIFNLPEELAARMRERWGGRAGQN